MGRLRGVIRFTGGEEEDAGVRPSSSSDLPPPTSSHARCSLHLPTSLFLPPSHSSLLLFALRGIILSSSPPLFLCSSLLPIFSITSTLFCLTARRISSELAQLANLLLQHIVHLEAEHDVAFGLEATCNDVAHSFVSITALRSSLPAHSPTHPSKTYSAAPPSPSPTQPYPYR